MTNYANSVPTLLHNEHANTTGKPADRGDMWHEVLAKNPLLRKVATVLLEAFSGTRGALLEKVRELNLAHIPFVRLRADELFSDLRKNDIDGLRGDFIYTTAQPIGGISADRPKSKPAFLDRKGLSSKVRDFVPLGAEQEYEVVLSEVVDLAYIVALHVDRDGSVSMEGNFAPFPPTRNDKMPDIRMHQAKFTKTLHYEQLSSIQHGGYEEMQDPELRDCLLRAYKMLPAIGVGRESQPRPGYYEFYVIKEDGIFKPRFYEVRNSFAFNGPLS